MLDRKEPENRIEKTRVKKNRKRKTALLIVVLCLAVVCTAVAAGFVYVNHMSGKMDYEDTQDAEWDIDDQVAEELSGYRQIAILGVDARSMTNYDGARSDSILVVSIENDTGKIKMISLMRDCYLQIYNNDGELSLDKITHAHAFGGGVDTCRSLNRNLDLNIKEYAIFNWKAVADVVDALGGVTVEVKSNELYDLNKYGVETGEVIGRSYTTVNATGVQKLDGVQAASYCRIRKTSGGDSQRAERMKKVMTAIFAEAKDMNISKLNKIANTVLPEIRTNIGRTDIISLIAGLGKYQLDGNISLPYKFKGGIFNGVWYAVPKTLETNVIKLHNQAFGQLDYTVSKTVLGINKKIITDTGVTSE